MARTMTGAEIVLTALADQGVEMIFGYPGGAVLPIYDELFQQSKSATSSFARRAGPFMRRKGMLDRPAKSAFVW